MKNEPGIFFVRKFSLDKIFLQFSKEQKIAEELNTLHSCTDNGKQLYREFLGRKLSYIFFGVICLAVLFLLVLMFPGNEGELKGNVITRNGYNGEEKSITLLAKSDGLKEEIEILVEPLHYTKEQLDVMADEVFTYVSDEIFCSKNQNGQEVYEVNEHREYITEIDGYPFLLSWESSNYDVLDNTGKIMDDVSKQGDEVCVTLELSCYEYIWEKDYILRVYPVAKKWKDDFLEKTKKAIEELDITTSEEKELLLPQEIDGHSIVYEEKEDSPYWILIVLSVVVLVLLWISMDNNLSKQIEDRNRQLLGDYAKLVSKLSLYLGAGLSFRTAVVKIVKGADKNRFYAKELEIVMHELENGISDNEAVERYANRCKLPCYVKLSVLINQNIRKGNNSIQKQLREETDKAFEEQKYLARKYAEEAATKLLFPMLLMLVVVMVMIMYPAFVSFTV